MVTVLLAAGIPVAYAVLMVVTARLLYKRWRPYTEPLKCTRQVDWPSTRHKHRGKCYRRIRLGLYTDTSVMLDTRGGIASLALTAALGWPLLLPVMGMCALVMTAGRELPEERDAATRRMERELGVEGADR